MGDPEREPPVSINMTTPRPSSLKSHSSVFAKLAELTREISIAMLTTETEGGLLRSRPMAMQQFDLIDGVVWFFTADDSPKAGEVARDWHVNLSYSAPEKNHFVSLSGRARVVKDATKARQLWKPAAKIWFPDGLEDPRLALLRVEIEAAEYWDAPSSRMVQLYGLAKLAITGEMNKSVGQNVKVEFFPKHSA
jgi:general stress protein 26